MTWHCRYEQDVLDAVAARRWPDRVDEPLAAHVRDCAICADAALVAAAFLADADASPADDTPLRPANLVWWRAQIRARRESARVASRPIAAVQIAATIVVAIAAIAVAPAASAWVRDLVARFGGSGWWPPQGEVSLSWILGAAAYTSLPLLAAGVWIVLAPVLVYFALDE